MGRSGGGQAELDLKLLLIVARRSHRQTFETIRWRRLSSTSRRGRVEATDLTCAGWYLL